ncbi:hypothetical protein CERZMDRAFT_89572 [Cercospora zeae-maydis SCOH1-5]|uniref:Uncharacterized protein n=1 Tax=Cercospora zeae-maydis SCOH1-5 TaxID=717836 RepID=A0A6A6FW08_9PEZI|nr:hypothetical protein CERZMDRAFT_89572 [Cercospora zeae-maydis SCOH1-5]
MGDISGDLANLSLEDCVAAAVRGFEQTQRSSHHKWLHLQVKEHQGSVDEQSHRDRLAQSLDYESWTALANEHNIATFADLPSVDFDSIRGTTRPPAPAEQRTSFLEHLQSSINRVYDQDSPRYRPVLLPEDYGILLSVTDGVRDIDLRKSGVSGIDGVKDSNVNNMSADEVEKLPYGNRLWRSGWEVSTGFILGQGSPPQFNWLVYYYCSRKEVTSRGPRSQKPDEITDEEKKWKWRLFYKEPERFQHSFFNPMVFPGIVEWLQFYQDWFTRLTQTYPAWKAKMARDVERLYPDNAEQEGDLGPG